MRTALIALGCALLVGCSGGGEDPAASRTLTPPSQTPPSTPQVQPEMLTATPDGLLRGRADGQGQRLIVATPYMYWPPIMVTQGQVVYSANGDVWAVRTDGTNDRAVINTSDWETVLTVTGPWLIYGTESVGRSVFSYGSVNIETGARFDFDDGDEAPFMPASPTRLITRGNRQITSISVTGTDRITYARLNPEEPDGSFWATQIVGNTLIYARGWNSHDFSSRSYAIPLAGGTAVLLDEERYDTYSRWSVGDRVVYHRCEPAIPPSYQCDVASVQTNGTDRVILTTHPANEAVQGVIGDRVIIRRNLNGHDQLLAVPVTGGPETLLMTVTNGEFVVLIAGERLILWRSAGTWSLDLNGTLTQLGTVESHYGTVAVGDAVCAHGGLDSDAVWCMPLDGSGPQVKIADYGRVVAVLTP